MLTEIQVDVPCQQTSFTPRTGNMAVQVQKAESIETLYTVVLRDAIKVKLNYKCLLFNTDKSHL